LAQTECRVCGSRDVFFFVSADGTDYFRCPSCHATFSGSKFLLGPEEERSRYACHKNDPSDPGYRKFLGKLAGPLLDRLGNPKEGLDFGCGTGPALAQMLAEAGHNVALYDPFFYPHRSVLEKQYDFVTCTEVFEHFHHPARELKFLDSLLRPGGLLAVMTCFQTDDAKFKDWHYRRDPTHVVFYKEETMRFVAGMLGWDIEIPVKDVAFFAKSRQAR
jgi:SAM-dependent methyltransferase